MTEPRIRYITNDDIQDVITPCYITSNGECYQYHKKKKKVVKKTPHYDKQCKSNKIVINKHGGKSTTMLLATTVYKYFSGEKHLPLSLFLRFKDGDITNCNISNLERIREYTYIPEYRERKHREKYSKNREKSAKMSEITKKKKKQTLTLTDFSSFLALFELMKRHKPLVLTPNEVILDTEYLSPEELNRLKKMKLDERVKII